MKYKECFIGSHALSIILKGFTIEFVPITTIILPKMNLEHLELGGLRASSLEAPGLHDTKTWHTQHSNPQGPRIARNISSFSGLWSLASEPVPSPWRPQVYMTLLLEHTKHSNPQGPRIALTYYKSESGKSKWWLCFSSSLMKRVLNFMRNPKLGHILVYIDAW